MLLVSIAGHGFNPTDEGVVASAARRVLSGQIPHVDFISPRPAASVYLHLPELLLPTPAFLTGRAVALAEIIAYSLLLAWLVFDRAPANWGIGAIAGVISSALINLNTAPLMPWYTIDGILFAALGLVLLRSALRRNHVGLVAAAFGCLALSALTKQSFVPALAIGAVWIVAVSPKRQRRNRLVIGLASATVVMGAYVAAIGVAGGLPDMVRQVLSNRPVVGAELLAPFEFPLSILVLTGVPAALVLMRNLDLRSFAGRRRDAAPVVASIVLTTLVLTITASSGLRVTGSWGILLTWLLAAYVASQAVIARRIDGIGLVLVTMAWMTSLSYGQPVPNLVAGSMVLTLLHRTWRDMSPWPVLPAMKPLTLVFLILVALTVPTFASARIEYVHRDAPRAQLTADLGDVSHELRGIVTHERTALYMDVMQDCAAAHPARWIAVIPDNAAAYSAFGWDNPLPVDFLFPPEYEGARARIISAASELAERGNYLVLFQRVRADSLPGPAIPDDPSGIHSYDPRLTHEIRTLLAASSRLVGCGEFFEGFYAPSP